MERAYYNAETLEGELAEFECRYGMPSADFFEAHLAGSDPDEVDVFDRVVWADLYGVVCRLREREAMTDQSALQGVC